MERLVGIFGAGGFAREIAPLLSAQYARYGMKVEIVFVDRDRQQQVNGYSVIEEEAFLASKRQREFVVAIADAKIRRRLYDLAIASNAEPVSIRSKSAEILDTVKIGPGAILCSFSSITSNTHAGRGLHVNIQSYVAHDCILGDFVTIGPHVVCAGNVTIEDDVYVGGGALIRQARAGERVTIGKGATIGMGAVVTKNVPPGVTVVGNPARALLPR